VQLVLQRARIALAALRFPPLGAPQRLNVNNVMLDTMQPQGQQLALLAVQVITVLREQQAALGAQVAIIRVELSRRAPHAMRALTAQDLRQPAPLARLAHMLAPRGLLHVLLAALGRTVMAVLPRAHRVQLAQPSRMTRLGAPLLEEPQMSLLFGLVPNLRAQVPFQRERLQSRMHQTASIPPTRLLSCPLAQPCRFLTFRASLLAMVFAP